MFDGQFCTTWNANVMEYGSLKETLAYVRNLSFEALYDGVLNLGQNPKKGFSPKNESHK